MSGTTKPSEPTNIVDSPELPTGPDSTAPDVEKDTSDAEPQQQPLPDAPAQPPAHGQAQKKDSESKLSEDEVRDIIEEFEYLLEKSQQLFSGLRDLPAIGSKYWQPHFQRTFEVYTRLWRFQGMHRVLLEKHENYGLKRWEVGEIASKIGQLYYHYYLRTSDTHYLHEAYDFYEAIRERSYFKDSRETKNSALMIKKLRYYARFIVVCLLMDRKQVTLQLLAEVKDLIDVYSATFNPVDKMEWSLVVKEMSIFMQAVCNPIPKDEHGILLPLNYRMVARRRPRPDSKDPAPRFRLQEAIIVGSKQTQIKFSELTLDMYYILHALEREPGSATASALASVPTVNDNSAAVTAAAAAVTADSASAAGIEMAAGSAAASNTDAAADGLDKHEKQGKTERTDTAERDEKTERVEGPKGEADGGSKGEREEKAVRRTNPHKYLLYQPTFSHIQMYLANVYKEITDHGCVLLYLSSDGSASPQQDSGSATEPAKYGFSGGVATVSRSSPSEARKDREITQLANTLHPVDILTYTRKAFFLIVESERSRAYKGLPNIFAQSLICLLSPTEYPLSVGHGSLYTAFLHSPLLAFAAISRLYAVSAANWTVLEEMFGELEDLVAELLDTHLVEHGGVRRFMADDFLRQFMVRHVVCHVVLGLHVDFNLPQHLPAAEPEFPADVLDAPAAVRKAREIVEFCAVEQHYRMEDSPQSPVVPSAAQPTESDTAEPE